MRLILFLFAMIATLAGFIGGGGLSFEGRGGGSVASAPARDAVAAEQKQQEPRPDRETHAVLREAGRPPVSEPATVLRDLFPGDQRRLE